MAKVIPAEYGPVFMVEMGVGPGRANNRHDVTLVQYLMNLWFESARMAAARQKLPPAQNKKLVVDGIFGPQTANRIKLLQKQFCAGKWPVICAGCIDKVPGVYHQFVKDTSQTYTMSQLNGVVYASYYKSTVDYIDCISARSDFPPSLKAMVSEYLFSLEL